MQTISARGGLRSIACTAHMIRRCSQAERRCQQAQGTRRCQQARRTPLLAGSPPLSAGSVHCVHIYVPPPMQGRTLRPPCSEAESHVPHSGQWKPRSSPKRPQHVGEFTCGMDVHKVRCSTCGSVNIGRRKTACGAQMGRQSQCPGPLGQDTFKRNEPLVHIVIIWHAVP